ncbi:MBL fold metallo-hydrolase [Dongia sp.]|uniref:MBL fold metallo-hydrolase n=1 Tax=Dongia sp. TaxID=1977262 RepID=UPI0035B19D01
MSVLAAIWMSILSTAAYSDSVQPSERVVNYLVVRETPEADGRQVGTLRPGESAQYLGDEPNRYFIQLTDGTKGYVSKAWARRVGAAATVVGTGELQIDFIDVGQGDSSLISCPNGRHILVDAGSTSDPEEDAIRDFVLKRVDEHQRSIDDLVITHADEDHYNLIPSVLHDVPVGAILRVGDMEDYRADFQSWLQDHASKTEVLSPETFDKEATPSAKLDCGAAKVWVLAAAVKAKKSPKNAMSIVLMVRFGDFEAILTGDATTDTEKVILERYSKDWLRVDLLKIGHHGSLATSTGTAWAQALEPKYAVVSSGYDSKYGHPRKEVVQRLEPFTQAAAPHAMRYFTGKSRKYQSEEIETYAEAIYSTAVSGNITVITDGKTTSLSTAFFEE